MKTDTVRPNVGMSTPLVYIWISSEFSFGFIPVARSALSDRPQARDSLELAFFVLCFDSLSWFETSPGCGLQCREVDVEPGR